MCNPFTVRVLRIPEADLLNGTESRPFSPLTACALTQLASHDEHAPPWPSNAMATRMRQLTVIAALLSLAACKKTEPQPQATKPAPAIPHGAQVRLPVDDTFVPPTLTFTIDAVYEKHTPIDDAPFHAAGGEWTFFDASLERDAKAKFTVGLQLSRGEGHISFGRARLVSPNAAAGAAWVSAFSKVFGGKTIAPTKPGNLRPFDFAIAALGRGERDAHGAFTGDDGPWLATKWFPHHHDLGTEPEVFFNYDLAARRGEFSEKDPEYADELAEVFSYVLRDGEPPPRTPENDSTLTTLGPTFENERSVSKGRVRSFDVSAQSLVFVEESGATSTLKRFVFESGSIKELMRTDEHFDRVMCQGQRCLVRVTKPQEPNVFSSNDPARLVLIEEDRQMAVPTGAHTGFGSLSPDGRYLAIEQWRRRAQGPGQYQVVLLADRQTQTTKELSEGERSWRIVGWEQRGAQTIAQIENGFSFEPNRQPYDLDVATFVRTRATRALQGDLDPKSALSPDGVLRREINNGVVTITNVRTGKSRTLALHPNDARHSTNESVGWLDSNTLSLIGSRFPLLDATSLKVSLPLKPDDTAIVEAVPGFRHVVLTRGHAVTVADVVFPKH